MLTEYKRQWSHDAVNILISRQEEVIKNGWGDLKAAHIDTGIRPCAALGNWVLWNEGLNLLAPGELPIPQGASGRGTPLDHPTPEHGTRTASVLCGHHPEFFLGAAPCLPIIPIRAQADVVLDSLDEQDRVGRAILYALNAGCKVITISMGVPLFLRGAGGLLGQAVDAAYEQGVIVCAAGGQEYGAVCYPGKFYRAIAVGGFTYDAGKRYPVYYPYGGMSSFIDVWGAAKPIFRANGTKAFDPSSEQYGSSDGEYAKGDGTSYATPLVAAAAAYWLHYKGVDIRSTYKLGGWQVVEAFRLLLKCTAVQTAGNGFAEPDGQNSFVDQRVRVPGKNEQIPRKGMDAPDGWGISGRLNVEALLTAKLPDPSLLHYEDRLAINQHR
ncbi:MAG: S8/S53 family peptidase [Rhodospirillaceae bacterium]|nr:S8/S53 family peptidase [Rhodospirillales bacterium]